jgi:hypothetical protein
MCDPISLASAAATWAVNKLLDRLSSAAITALLGSEGLDKEVALLRDALRRANLVLGAVPAGAAAGVRIGNQQLVPQIDEMQRLAADLAKYLDELEYYKIKEKVHPIFPPSLPLFAGESCKNDEAKESFFFGAPSQFLVSDLLERFPLRFLDGLLKPSWKLKN